MSKLWNIIGQGVFFILWPFFLIRKKKWILRVQKRQKLRLSQPKLWKKTFYYNFRHSWITLGNHLLNIPLPSPKILGKAFLEGSLRANRPIFLGGIHQGLIELILHQIPKDIPVYIWAPQRGWASQLNKKRKKISVNIHTGEGDAWKAWITSKHHTPIFIALIDQGFHSRNQEEIILGHRCGMAWNLIEKATQKSVQLLWFHQWENQKKKHLLRFAPIPNSTPETMRKSLAKEIENSILLAPTQWIWHYKNHWASPDKKNTTQ
jgi:hypothetical protein